MSHYICKITNDDQSWYLEWSTIVDAPITFGMSLDEFKGYYRDEYGRSSMAELERRLERVEQKGTSSMLHDNVDNVMAHNKAGKNGTRLTKQQIIDVYCTQIIPEKEKPVGIESND